MKNLDFAYLPCENVFPRYALAPVPPARRRKQLKRFGNTSTHVGKPLEFSSVFRAARPQRKHASKLTSGRVKSINFSPQGRPKAANNNFRDAPGRPRASPGRLREGSGSRVGAQGTPRGLQGAILEPVCSMLNKFGMYVRPPGASVLSVCGNMFSLFLESWPGGMREAIKLIPGISENSF